MVVVQHHCPPSLLAILCPHRECRSGQKKDSSMVPTSLAWQSALSGQEMCHLTLCFGLGGSACSRTSQYIFPASQGSVKERVSRR